MLSDAGCWCWIGQKTLIRKHHSIQKEQITSGENHGKTGTSAGNNERSTHGFGRESISYCRAKQVSDTIVTSVLFLYRFVHLKNLLVYVETFCVASVGTGNGFNFERFTFSRCRFSARKLWGQIRWKKETLHIYKNGSYDKDAGC